jgi:alanine or glycine:cation symporter, AGCS family
MLVQLHQLLDSVINSANTLLWSYVLIGLLVVTGLYFTVRTGFAQVRLLPQSVRQLLCSGSTGDGISGWQAFATGLANRVGTGNIAGVAVAITMGGPGAVFWMWMTALVGMASSLIESTLGQIFKVRHTDGTFRGGPAYYIHLGLGSRALGSVFAISLLLALGCGFNAVQSQSIAESLETAFGWSRAWVGVGLVALTAPIIFGGLRRVAHVSAWMVPLMAGGYLMLAGWVVIVHFAELPGVLLLIVKSAFGLEPAIGGVAGYGLSQILISGVRRGLFSNEAGMGSAPNASATATTSHPVNQGLLQMLGVGVDTLVICSATAFIILLSGSYSPGAPVQGATLTQTAVISEVGSWGGGFLAVAIFFFAFSSIVGNYAFSEGNVQFITRHPLALLGFRLMVLAMVMIGTVASLPTLLNLADLGMGIMAVINLVAIVLLGRHAFGALRHLW